MTIKLTDTGVSLLLDALAEGTEIEFSKIVLGNGADAGSSATAVSNPIVTLSLTACVRQTDYVKLTATFNNATLDNRFSNTELGVLVTDPDDSSATLLFAYGYVPESEAAVIPAKTDYVLETTENVMVYVGAAENITAIIAESLDTVSRTEFQQHTGNTSNPHAVTKSQVGLGNVPDVTTDNQTPTVIAASQPTPLAQGDTLRAIVSKIAAAINALLNHFGAHNNPHGVTAAQTGAAPTVHTHSTDDITSGTLSELRGGTGVTSYAALVARLKNDLRCPDVQTYVGDGNSGSGHKNNVDFGYVPRLIRIYDMNGYTFARFCPTETYGASYATYDGDLRPYNLNVSVDGTNVKWYESTGTNSQRQMNTSGHTYYVEAYR